MTRLIVVPDGEPVRELAPRTYPFRMVRPHEPVVADGGLLHPMVPDQPEHRQVTGCGVEIPTTSRIVPAYQLQGTPLCPRVECFGEDDE